MHEDIHDKQNVNALTYIEALTALYTVTINNITCLTHSNIHSHVTD